MNNQDICGSLKYLRGQVFGRQVFILFNIDIKHSDVKKNLDKIKLESAGQIFFDGYCKTGFGSSTLGYPERIEDAYDFKNIMS